MFIPPHCPNPECEAYLNVPETPWYRKNSPCQTITFGSVPIFIQSCVTDMLKRANGVSLDVTGLLSTGSEIDGYKLTVTSLLRYDPVSVLRQKKSLTIT